MGRIGQILTAVAVLCAVLAGAAWAAGGLTALAEYEPRGSFVADQGAGGAGAEKAGLQLALALSRPVPYRISTLDNPPRVVLDFREVDFRAFDPKTFVKTRHVTAVRAGLLEPGWSRLVVELDGPYGVGQAAMATHNLAGRALVELTLAPVSAAAFAASVGAPAPRLWSLPKPAELPPPKRRQDGSAPLVVVLDPGHGGIDPGSINGKFEEKAITLSFATALRDMLVRQGIHVVMTRSTDVFVPLEARLSIARAAGADLFLSIHADAEETHEATGATVYTLASKATDQAAAELAARHDRDDLMAGVDLSNTDDQIATVLMDLARTENQPRSEQFAAALV